MGDRRLVTHNTSTGEREFKLRGMGDKVLREYNVTGWGSASGGQGGEGWVHVKDFLYGPEGVFATRTRAGNATYLHKDHLGTPRLLTDDDGDEVGRHDYYPFGTEIPRSGQADEPTKKYTGHERDPNGRADYMLGRTYLYPFMRFATPDPARDGWSLYAYTGNNPVNYVDPDGEVVETLWDLGNVVVGAVSLAKNLSEGNLGAAAVDAGGLVVDGLASITPFVPGGAGTAIKAGRAADDVVDVVQAGRAAEEVIDAAKAVGDGLLTSGGRLIGEVGTSSSVRIVEGGVSAAEELFSGLAKGGVDITPSGHPGQLVRLPSGGIVGFRPLSKSRPATVDVNLPGVNIRKVKFVE